MLEWIRFLLAAALMLSGLLVMISAVAGVNRFRYVMNRMHAAAMGDTLGILLIVLGLVAISGFQLVSLKLLLVVVLWWLSSPVSSHLIGKLEITTNPHLDQYMAIKTESDPHQEVDG